MPKIRELFPAGIFVLIQHGKSVNKCLALTISARKKAAIGMNADSRRLAVTNSMEPAKINILIKNGYHTENFALHHKSVGHSQKKENPLIGIVYGNAALNAFFFIG